MTTIKLSIKDRVLLPQIFSYNKDSITEASIQRSIRQLFNIEVDEAKKINLTQTKQGYIWDALKGIDRDFEINPIQINYLKESIFNLSRSGGVSQDLLPICERLNSL